MRGLCCRTGLLSAVNMTDRFCAEKLRIRGPQLQTARALAQPQFCCVALQRDSLNTLTSDVWHCAALLTPAKSFSFASCALLFLVPETHVNLSEVTQGHRPTPAGVCHIGGPDRALFSTVCNYQHMRLLARSASDESKVHQKFSDECPPILPGLWE